DKAYTPIARSGDRYRAMPLYYGMLMFAQAARGALVPAHLAPAPSGLKGFRLLLAGLAQPSSQTTPSGSTSHILAARMHSSWINFLAVSTTAMPVAKVTREPPVRCV